MPAQQWTLRTRTTDYVVSLLDDGSGLTLDYWGARTTAPIARWSPVDPVPPFEHRLDTAPLEFASAGQRQNAFAELLIDRPDGLTGAVWTAELDGIRFVSDPEGDALEVPFVDETGALRLTLHTVTRATHDVVRRWMTIENRGPEPVELPRAFSAAWNVLPSRAVDIHFLAGRWIQENQQRVNSLAWGTFSMGSRQGITSHAFTPTVTIQPTIDPDVRAAVPAGAWGVALEWSGNWRLQVDSNPMGQRGVRVSCGVDDDTTTVVLDAGERFAAPPSAGVFAASGPDGVTAAWHDYQRLELARDLGTDRHPVVYNSWFSTEFDVRIEHQLALARRARDLGVEAFVLDDGWFRGRTSDHAGLGDWQPDPAKFPHGLAELADGVTALGMDFGLWIEPEMVNPDSDLYRAHPDWVYRAGDRPLLTNRHQYVLDLGRPEVEEWAAQTLRSVLGSANIRYLKWDMNRSITDGGRPGDRHGREWSVQHTLAYYRLMRLVRDEYPHVTVEACSGGGGRVDHAVLGLADVVWVSDETGPRDRLTIQHGYLSAYPAHTMLSIVTAHPGLRTPDRVSLAYRFAMGMTGVLGVGTDLLAWSEDELAEATRWIARYKDIRDVVLRGRVATHGVPNDHRYAVEFAGPDGRVVIVVFSHEAERDGIRTGLTPVVYPRLLADGRRYRVAETGQVVDRAAAAVGGVAVPFVMAPDVDILVLEPLP